MFKLNHFSVVVLSLFLITSSALGSKKDTDVREQRDRAREATQVMTDIMKAPDDAIPEELMKHADAIAVIPHVVKGAFGFGGLWGKGLVSHRMDDGSWSTPSFINVGGGSFGFQIGVNATDLVLVFTNHDGFKGLLEGKLKLSGVAEATAGPVGRNATAGTDVLLKSAVYAYSRSKGLFVGVSFDGSVVTIDDSANRKVYGKNLDGKDILLNGRAQTNDMVQPFVDALTRYSPPPRPKVTQREQQDREEEITRSKPESAPAEETARMKPAGADVAIDPNALAALKRMTAFLRTQKTFSIKSESSRDEVVDGDMKVQKNATNDIAVRLPDRFYSHIRGDDNDVELIYDGTTLSLFSRKQNYYASKPAPPTVARTLDAIRAEHGIVFPLADFIHMAAGENMMDDVTDAGYLGTSRVGGVECDHIAVRQGNVDWQVWIERSNTPLPRKIVITTRDEPTQPQYMARLNWDLSPVINDRLFTFTPPPDAARIKFGRLKDDGTDSSR